VLDAATGAQPSAEARAALWKLRESIPEAQRHEGASLKHDISASDSGAPRNFVARAASWIGRQRSRWAGWWRTATWATGNLHFNISQSAGQ